MTKTSVYLNDEEIAKLAAVAASEGISQAELIRRAIRRYEPERSGERQFALAGSADGPGGSIADLSEEELLGGFGS